MAELEVEKKVGMGFAYSHALAAATRAQPLVDAYRFALATGAAVGILMGLKFFASVFAGVGLGVGVAGIAFGAVRSVDGPGRTSNIGLLGIMLTLAVLASVTAATERLGFGNLALWVLGDLSGARGPGAFAVLSLMLILCGLISWRIRDCGGSLFGEEVATRSGQSDIGTLRLVVLGLAIGAGGLLAFVGWFACLLVNRFTADRMLPHLQLALTGLVGASLVMAADSVPRLLLGGYAPVLSVSIGVVALPCFLWWNRSRLKAAAGSGRSLMFEGTEVLLIGSAAIALAVIVYGAVYFVGFAT
jgi:ABC-type Fe3+-siderophore transport system permease subunit